MTVLASHLEANDLTLLPAPTTNRIRTLLWMTPIIAATILSKLSVSPLGEQGIGIALPLVLAMTLFGCAMRQFHVDTARFVFGALTLSLLVGMQLMKNDVFYSSSLLMLVALHMPMLLRFRTPLPNMDAVVKFFIAICTLCACCGILQFVLQSVIESRWLFPIDNLVPDNYQVKNYNNQAPLEYGSTVLRANGVFMMEPSYLSQLLALAIVTELVTRNRWRYVVLFVTAMLVSYSGTGFMVLAVCLPAVIVMQRRWGLVVTATLIAMAVLVVAQSPAHPFGRQFDDYLHLDTLTARINEFNSTGSSGFARFVGGFYLFNQFLWDHPVHALLGVGAGMFKEYAPLAHYPVAEMPLFKMVLEFGLCGALLYFSFLFFCLSSSSLPGVIAVALGITFFLNGLYGPFAHPLALSLLMWTSKGARVPTLGSRLATGRPAMEMI